MQPFSSDSLNTTAETLLNPALLTLYSLKSRVSQATAGVNLLKEISGVPLKPREVNGGADIVSHPVQPESSFSEGDEDTN